jgi:hypothetical protein
MAINYNDPYNQGIGAPDLGNINLGNVGQMPVNNMQTAGWLPTFLGGTTAEEDAQNAALEQIEGLRIDQMKGIPQGKTEVETQSIIDDLQYTNPDKLKKYQDIEKQIQDLKKQYPENINIQQAYLGNDFYNEYGYPKTADLSGTTGITTLSGNFGLLSENADISRSIDEQVTEYENEYMNRTGKVPPMFYGEKYRMKLQIEFLKKQEQKKTTPQGEKKRIEQEKIKAAQDNWKPTYNPASSHAEAKSTGGDYHSDTRSTVDGQTTEWGDELFSRGGLAQYAPRGSYFDGGLASLWLR